MTFTERQMVQRGDLVPAIRGRELRRFRALLLTWILIGLWIEQWGLPNAVVTLVVGVYAIGNLFIWLDARATRIGLTKMSEHSDADAPPPLSDTAHDN
jgi:hypothetical protein